MGVAPLQPVQPVDPEAGALVARPRGPERDILLPGKVFARPVGAAVVNDQEVIHPEIAVVFQEERQPDPLVPERREAQDRIRADPFHAADDGFQLPPLSYRAKAPSLTLQPQSVGGKDAHAPPIDNSPHPPPVAVVPPSVYQIRLNTALKCSSQAGRTGGVLAPR